MTHQIEPHDNNILPEFDEMGVAAICLLQGVVYEQDEATWNILLTNEFELETYFLKIGLSLIVNRGEGLAYLRQFDDEYRTGGYERLPRLFRKTPLGYEPSLLCVLLRDEYRRFEDEDLDNERCVVQVDTLFDTWKAFFPKDADEFKLRERLVKSLKKLDDLKFVSVMSEEADSWEVKKLLKARVPVEDLEKLLRQMSRTEPNERSDDGFTV